MRIGSGGLLSAALACVLLLAGTGAQAAPADDAVGALREIAARTHTATRETLAAHAAHRDVETATLQAAKALRGRFDAIARRAAADGFAADAAFSRKSRSVGELLANLERAAAAPRDAALPALIPSPGRLATVAAGAGASCATALSVAPGDALDAVLAPAGAARSTLWLRIAPSKSRFIHVDTAPSALDTEITVFGATCPAGDAGAIARNDDAFGLSAAVTIDAQQTSGFLYARVRNLERSAGAVIARVSDAGAIVGRVTDMRNGQPIYAIVNPVTPDGYILGGTSTDETTGLYLLSVDPGSYYVLVDGPYSPDYAYVTELYPDAPCQPYVYNLADCDTAHATLLTIADGQELAGIDVALGIGARIAGVARDAATGLPLANVGIAVYDANGYSVGFAVGTDAAGRYLIPGLLTGEYFVQASLDGYGSQRWNHFTCGGPVETDCQLLDGTALAIVRDTLTSGIDFDLPREAHLHATVSTRDGTPYEGAWQLWLFDQAGNYLSAIYAYGDATLDSPALADGSYRAFVTAQDYFGQLWNGIDCPVDCNTQLSQGTLITVTHGETADIAFSLLHVPTVSGTITDAATHVPLANISVTLVPTDFNASSVSTFTDSAGRYVLTPQAVGSYYVWATSQTYRGTLYPDVPCSGNGFQDCDTSAATPIAIAFAGPDATGIDMALPIDGSVSGHVVLHTPDGMNLAPIVPQYSYVQIYSPTGGYIATGNVQADGSYQIADVPEGTYYAIVQGAVFIQIYPGIDCDTANCSPLQGSPITVASAADTGGIDFNPVPLEYIFGRVTDADGAPIPGVAIDLWRDDGRHCGIGVTNADGYYAATDNLTYCQSPPMLSTDADSSVYENEVYEDIPCPRGSVFLDLCSLDGATPVPFPTTLTYAIANFMLDPRTETIFTAGFDP